MSSFSESVLQDKLTRLTSSQDSIETLSSWIIHHRTHASTSVTKWLQNFVHSNEEKQIVLLYLANDVLQNSRRKSVTSFQELFKGPLKHVASITSSQKNQQAFAKIISLWQERRIYDAIYLNELQQYIEPVQKVLSNELESSSVTGDFKLSILEDCLTELQKFEGEMKVKEHALSRLAIDVSSMSSLSQLKDKSSGGKFEADFEDASKKLMEYHECMGIEVDERKNLVSMLKQCNSYQAAKSKELKKLLEDYGNIKKHFENVQEKLKERVEQLEKAKHTATSDPTSQEDIIVAGDMEIDSDGEDQGQQPNMAPAAAIVPSRGVPPSQGVPSLQSQVVSTFQPQGISPFPPSLGVSPLPPQGVRGPLLPSRPALPPIGPPYPSMSPYPNNDNNRGIVSFTMPTPPPVNQPIPLHPTPTSFTPVPYSPSMPKVYTPRLPLSSPHSLPVRPFYTPVKDSPPIQLEKPPMSRVLPSVTDNYPDSIKAPEDNYPPTVTPLKPHPSVSPNKNEIAAKPTLGNTSTSNIRGRSKDDKMIPLSLFQDYSDSDSDTEVKKPYSPSEAVMATTTESVLDEDKESIPTPNMTPPTPDYVTFSTNNSLNMGSSMLVTASTNIDSANTKPLQQSEGALPNHFKAASPTKFLVKRATPTFHEDTDVSGSGTVTNSQSVSRAIMNLASSINFSQSTSITPPQQQPSATVQPENIKITPTFTNLLDKIFPQLSQSLQSERKRKQYPNNDVSLNKVSRSDQSDGSIVAQQQQGHLNTPTTTIGIPSDSNASVVQSKSASFESNDDINRYEMEIQNIAKNSPAPPPSSSLAPPVPYNIMSQPRYNPNSYLQHPRPPNYHPQPMGPRMFPPGIPQRPSVAPPYGGSGQHPRLYHNQNAAPLRPRYY